MKKNGFTLIELLAAITLLAILATLTINITVKKINEAKEKNRYTLIESIEMAAKQYVLENSNEIEDFSSKDYAYITLETLVRKEMFTNSLVDPVTKKAIPLSNVVYVTRSVDGKINAYYDEYQYSGCRIELKGSYNMYVKKDSEFIDPGASIIYGNGNAYDISGSDYGYVDTSTIGTYELEYFYCNLVTRNVIVY